MYTIILSRAIGAQGLGAYQVAMNLVCLVVAISASGNPKYLLGVLSEAEKIGCKTIALTCNHKAAILEEVSLL